MIEEVGYVGKVAIVCHRLATRSVVEEATKTTVTHQKSGKAAWVPECTLKKREEQPCLSRWETVGEFSYTRRSGWT